MLTLLGHLNCQRYAPRSYVVAATDRMGAAKAAGFETAAGCSAAGALVDVIPRSREVGQSYVSSVGTTLRALATATLVVLRRRPQLLLVNGPGTCIPICMAALLFRCQARLPAALIYDLVFRCLARLLAALVYALVFRCQARLLAALAYALGFRCQARLPLAPTNEL